MVAWSAPASGARLSTTAPNTLSATASDDKGIARVDFLDDERTVCSDTTAPYTCDYRPQGDDVGRNTLVAIAVDTSGQTASAVRAVVVPRFAGRLSARTTPSRDTRAPYRFTTTGRLTLPAAVTPAQGCRGTDGADQGGSHNRLDAARQAALELHVPVARDVPDQAQAAPAHAQKGASASAATRSSAARSASRQTLRIR